MVRWFPFIASILHTGILPENDIVVRFGAPEPSNVTLSTWPSDSILNISSIPLIEIGATHLANNAYATLKCFSRNPVCSIEKLEILIPTAADNFAAEIFAAEISPVWEDIGRWAGNMTAEFPKVVPNPKVTNHPGGWWYEIQLTYHGSNNNNQYVFIPSLDQIPRDFPLFIDVLPICAERCLTLEACPEEEVELSGE